MHPHFVTKSNVWSPAPITAINEFLFICSLWMITAGLLGYFCQNISLKFFPLLLTKSLIKTQFSTELKVLKSDCVGEYISRAFTQVCYSHGISYQFSCPYTPQQNGVVERKHRHIVESAFSMLSQDNLPLTHWSYAAS